MNTIDPALRIDAVELAVSDLAGSADFYERVLGLAPMARTDERATFGPDRSRPALTLTQLADPTIAPAGATGLFHVAWLHPSRAALADTVRRVLGAGWRLEGASDHGVSEALYLADPDGLGIEIYADRPRESWRHTPDGRGVEMVTLPLDVEDLLLQSPGDPAPRVDEGTSIGHVHLKVADVARADAFYTDTLGFQEMALMPSAAFVAAGGYHHHLGMNSWQSAGGSPAPASTPGLREIRFGLSEQGLVVLHEATARADATASREGERLPLAGEELTIRDPDGQLLVFAAS